MFERLEAVPGVRFATFSRLPCCRTAPPARPLTACAADFSGRKVTQTGEVYLHHVRENFFAAMEIPLLLGRSFTPQDDARQAKVAVVESDLRRMYFSPTKFPSATLGFDSRNPRT